MYFYFLWISCLVKVTRVTIIALSWRQWRGKELTRLFNIVLLFKAYTMTMLVIMASVTEKGGNIVWQEPGPPDKTSSLLIFVVYQGQVYLIYQSLFCPTQRTWLQETVIIIFLLDRDDTSYDKGWCKIWIYQWISLFIYGLILYLQSFLSVQRRWISLSPLSLCMLLSF